ncbi:MAG: DUF192 domain-containing protein [Candidatus Paceibacterota bacterium]|jgi:hypothetical protein
MKKKKVKPSLIFLALFSVFAVSYFFWEPEKKDRLPSVCIENNCFSAEIADTSQERERGLMNRVALKENGGMLFVFEKEDVYKFWMKNTLIPLDMIWIGNDNKIIFIKENAQPCKTEACESFGPDGKARYVFEINGGLAKLRGINVGDTVEIKD